ncbi:hypothetical protein [Paludibacterium paludis]|uniref:Uncharacterized protein n=1 Tax=Paludibacterium paludis TaxID=1225769 RepID=A0A918NX93_9NEIS|nr:hypothetical protein [Paludibacterium paludis]GGY03821.1 hypothetical protein GCM10011289_02700 [Paludibacterium paludis]
MADLKPWTAWGWDATAPFEQRGVWQGEAEPAGLPDRITFDPPPPALPGKCICRDTKAACWVYKESV